MPEIKTHYKKLMNPDYLGEYEFTQGQEIIATIACVDINEITGAGGKKDTKPVMHFAEQNIKPLILNTTNFKMLTKLFNSPYIEDWTGKQITLYGDPNVKFGGETVGGVRIRRELPAKSISESCESCGKVVADAGKFRAKQIIAASRNQYGKTLCVDCAKLAKEAAHSGEK